MSQATENPREPSAHPGTRDRGEAEHFDQTPAAARDERRPGDEGPAAQAGPISVRRTREKGN